MSHFKDFNVIIYIYIYISSNVTSADTFSVQLTAWHFFFFYLFSPIYTYLFTTNEYDTNKSRDTQVFLYKWQCIIS